MKKTLLLFIFGLLLCFGGRGLYCEIKEYRDGEEEYAELQQYVVKIENKEDGQTSIGDENTNTDETITEVFEVNFETLKTLNSDCIAWISIPGTNIHYPVVNGSDNSYYVTHTFGKKRNKSGAIFLDMRNSSDFSDLNSVIYGHNLKNSKMFSDLKRFLEKSYFDEKREIIVYTPKKEYRYEIFAVYKTMEDDSTYHVKFTEQEFEEHLKSISAKAEILKTSEEEVNRIITLSTCSNNVEGERIVVIGRLVESKEE